MQSVKDRWLCVMKAALSGVSAAVPGFEVYRNRGAEFTKYPAANLIDGDEIRESASTQFGIWQASPHVELIAAGKTEDDATAALDDLYIRAVRALMADPSLGGYVIDIIEVGSTSIIGADGDRVTLGKDIEFQVRYARGDSDPAALAP